MQAAGAGDAFPYSAGHAAWITRSIGNRQRGRLNSALVGWRPGERPLAPGDLVGRSRDKGVTYDDAPGRGWFKSHSAIVVEIDPPNGRAYVVGGNVGHSVSRVEMAIDEQGRMKPDACWMVHIQNNIALGETVVAAKKDGAVMVG